MSTKLVKDKLGLDKSYKRIAKAKLDDKEIRLFYSEDDDMTILTVEQNGDVKYIDYDYCLQSIDTIKKDLDSLSEVSENNLKKY